MKYTKVLNIHETCNNDEYFYTNIGDLYMDADGDVAHEFYLATNDGGFIKIWPKD